VATADAHVHKYNAEGFPSYMITPLRLVASTLISASSRTVHHGVTRNKMGYQSQFFCLPTVRMLLVRTQHLPVISYELCKKRVTSSFHRIWSEKICNFPQVSLPSLTTMHATAEQSMLAENTGPQSNPLQAAHPSTGPREPRRNHKGRRHIAKDTRLRLHA